MSSFTDIEDSIPSTGSGPAPASAVTGGDMSSAVVTRPDMAPAEVPSGEYTPGRTQGEVRSTDVNIPKLTVVNPLSEAVGAHPVGTVLLAGEIPLAQLGDSFEFVVLGVRKEYEKVIPFGSEEKPVRAKTMAEVRQLGGTLDRKDTSRVAFQDVAYITVLVPCPKDADDNVQAYFRLQDPSGRRWAKALYFAKSFSYTNVAKPVITREQMTDEPHFFSTWQAVTEEQKNEKKKTRWYQFKKIKAGSLTSQDFRNWAITKA